MRSNSAHFYKVGLNMHSPNDSEEDCVWSNIRKSFNIASFDSFRLGHAMSSN